MFVQVKQRQKICEVFLENLFEANQEEIIQNLLDTNNSMVIMISELEINLYLMDVQLIDATLALMKNQVEKVIRVVI